MKTLTTLKEYLDLEDSFCAKIKRKVATGHTTQEAATRQTLGDLLEDLGVIPRNCETVIMNREAKILVEITD